MGRGSGMAAERGWGRPPSYDWDLTQSLHLLAPWHTHSCPPHRAHSSPARRMIFLRSFGLGGSFKIASRVIVSRVFIYARDCVFYFAGKYILVQIANAQRASVLSMFV